MFLANSLEKTLMLRKIEAKGEENDRVIDSMDMNLSRLWKIEEDRKA